MRRGRYVFFRFGSSKEALTVIRNMDGLWWYGRRLLVSLAKPSVQSREKRFAVGSSSTSGFDEVQRVVSDSPCLGGLSTVGAPPFEPSACRKGVGTSSVSSPCSSSIDSSLEVGYSSVKVSWVDSIGIRFCGGGTRHVLLYPSIARGFGTQCNLGGCLFQVVGLKAFADLVFSYQTLVSVHTSPSVEVVSSDRGRGSGCWDLVPYYVPSLWWEGRMVPCVQESGDEREFRDSAELLGDHLLLEWGVEPGPSPEEEGGSLLENEELVVESSGEHLDRSGAETEASLASKSLQRPRKREVVAVRRSSRLASLVPREGDCGIGRAGSSGKKTKNRSWKPRKVDPGVY